MILSYLLTCTSNAHVEIKNVRTQIKIKLCPRGAHTCARPLFRCCGLDINSMTLKLKGDLDILKMDLHTV